MNRVLYVSKSRLENTLEEYNTIYTSVTTWRSRMETQNSNIAASNEGATTETYTEKTTAYNDNELSDFSGHVNVMSCALVEALTKTRGLIARSEDFVNILKGESAESSDTYSNTSATGDVASYYDNFCSQEGFTGAIKDNTESITDLGIKEEENLTGIEDELKHLKTISVDISGYATHIRDCITKQNYTSPLYDSLKAYCIDVAVMHDYVKSIRDTYFPVLDGPREHNRSYNYDGAPTDDKENIYTSRIKELGFSERDIEVLKRYTGLTAEQLYNQISHMPGSEIANMLNLAHEYCRMNPSNASGSVDGLSDEGFNLLCSYELPYADDCEYDAEGNIISIPIMDVGDGAYTVSFGIAIDKDDEERIKYFLDTYGIDVTQVGQQIDISICRQIYNDNEAYYKGVVDSLIERTGFKPTQEQYDALYVAIYNRPVLGAAGGTFEKLIESGNQDYEHWLSTILNDYEEGVSAQKWTDYHEGWSNRTEDELELYFDGDYERTH